jgi:GNAT superfamily N-acetyltransferase
MVVRKGTHMPTLTTYSQNDFPSLYKVQAIAFMRCEWSSIFQGDNLYMPETYPPNLDPVHFVIAEGDTLLSYAALIRRSPIHEKDEYKVYGFGNMFTFAPFRRKGHGSQILRRATEYIRESDADVAILYCDPSLEGYYAAQGWAATRSETRMGHPDKYEVYEPTRMTLFISPKGLSNQAEFEHSPVYVDWPW